MRKNLLKSLFVSLVLVLTTSNAWAAPVMPEISDETNDYWYHIVFQRNEAKFVLNNEGGDELIKLREIVLGKESQLWKLENSDTEGFYKLISKTGETVYLDGGKFKAGTSITKLKLLVSSNATYPDTWEIQPEGSAQAMNPAGGVSDGREIALYTVGDNGNPIKFVSIAEGAVNAIANAQSWLVNTKEGTDVGTFTVASRDLLQAAINNGQAVLDNSNSTGAEVVGVATTVNTAIDVYKNSVIVPVISEGATEKWYYLQGTRPANTYITDNGGADFKNLAVIPNDTQLWKFVENGSGFALQNKATGNFIGTDVGSNVTMPSVAAAPANYLRFIASNIYTDKVVRFWIENEVGSTPALRFHSSGSSTMMNWTGNAADNSSYLILDYEVALKVFLLDAINEATTLYNESSAYEGSGFGQVSEESRTTLNNAIAAAQDIYDDAAANEEAIINGRTALLSTIATVNTIIDLIKLQSEDESKFSWFEIRNKAYNDVMSIATITRQAGSDYTGAKTTNGSTDADEGSDGALWRFELDNKENPTKFKIVNKEIEKAIQFSSVYNYSFPLVDVADGSWFVLEQHGIYIVIRYENEGEENYLHAGSNIDYEVVRWQKPADASHWFINFVEETDKPGREVSVVSSNEGLGSVAIVGEAGASVSTVGSVEVTATLEDNDGITFFNRWVDGDDNFVSSANPYTYTGNDDITLKAVFGSREGIAIADNIAVNDGKWYRIYSAYHNTPLRANALPVGMGTSALEMVLLADATNSKTTWGLPSEGDGELWTIRKNPVEANVTLVNKETGILNMSGNSNLNSDGAAFEFEKVEGTSPQQYRMKNTGKNWAILYYKNSLNVIDAWNTPVESNDQTTWYFVDSGELTSVNQSDINNTISIFAVNGLIQVTGSEFTPQVYTLTGAQVDARKALNAGIYIVKLGDYAQKVLVK